MIEPMMVDIAITAIQSITNKKVIAIMINIRLNM